MAFMGTCCVRQAVDKEVLGQGSVSGYFVTLTAAPLAGTAVPVQTGLLQGLRSAGGGDLGSTRVPLAAGDGQRWGPGPRWHRLLVRWWQWPWTESAWDLGGHRSRTRRATGALGQAGLVWPRGTGLVLGHQGLWEGQLWGELA